MRLLVALGVWVVAVLGAVAIGSAVETSTGGTGAGSSFSGTAGSSGTSGDFDASSVGAADSQSLFRKTNFPRALAAARARLGSNAQLNNFVLYPGYLSVSAATGSSELELYVDARGATRTISAPRNPAGDTLFSLSGIGDNAPSALAHRISRRAHVPAAQLQYMVAQLDPTTKQLRWLVYPVQGNRVEYFEARGASGPLLEYLHNGATEPQPLR